MCRTTFLSRRSGGKATIRRPLPDRSSYAALFALSSLVYEQLLSRLAQAFVVRSAVRRDVQGGVGEGGQAHTRSSFLYAAMTVLSGAVSPHQQRSVLTPPPKNQIHQNPSGYRWNRRVKPSWRRTHRAVGSPKIVQVRGRGGGWGGLYNAGTPCCAVNAAPRAQR